MKKREFILLSCTMLLTISCSEQYYNIASDAEPVKIMVSASVADNFTRSGADEILVADRCILEIYNPDGTLYERARIISGRNASGNFDFEPVLLSGHSYKLVFWADKSDGSQNGDLYYDTSEGLRAISMISGSVSACNIEQDAFFAVADISVDKASAISAVLHRAVCRLNVDTGFAPPETVGHMVRTEFANAPGTFDAFSGKVEGSVAFTSSCRLDSIQDGDVFQWFTYLFAPEEQGSRTVNFGMVVTPADETGRVEFEYDFTDIPLVRNFRINVGIE